MADQDGPPATKRTKMVADIAEAAVAVQEAGWALDNAKDKLGLAESRYTWFKDGLVIEDAHARVTALLKAKTAARALDPDDAQATKKLCLVVPQSCLEDRYGLEIAGSATSSSLGHLLATKFAVTVFVDDESAQFAARRDDGCSHWDLDMLDIPEVSEEDAGAVAAWYKIDHLDYHFHALLMQTEWNEWYTPEPGTELSDQSNFFGLRSTQTWIEEDTAEFYGEMSGTMETRFDIYTEI